MGNKCREIRQDYPNFSPSVGFSTTAFTLCMTCYLHTVDEVPLNFCLKIINTYAVLVQSFNHTNEYICAHQRMSHFHLDTPMHVLNIKMRCLFTLVKAAHPVHTEVSVLPWQSGSLPTLMNGLF